MIRRRHKLEVSTFPFLAVLLCAMGSLILVLLIFDRRAQASARARVALEAARQRQAADVAARVVADADRQRRAEWQARQDKARADWEAEQKRIQEQRTQEERQLKERKADVLRQKEQAASALQAEAARAEELRRQLEAERARLRSDEQTLATKKNAVALAGKKKEEEKAGLAQAQADLASLEATIKALQEARQREASTFSVVPYRGKHGDSRRPLYVECTSQGLVFHPDRLTISFPGDDDSVDQQTLGKVLTRARDEVLKRVAQQRAVTGPLPGKDAATGYVLFLVRPDGIVSYNLTQAALRGQPVDFGYEFVEADWILEIPAEGQAATEPWMTAQADHPPAVGTPYPTPAPTAQPVVGPGGLGRVPGGSGTTGDIAGNTGTSGPLRGASGPGGPFPGATGTGTGGSLGTGPALGGTSGQGGSSGTPGYRAVNLTGGNGDNQGSGGIGTRRIGDAGQGQSGEIGLPGGSPGWGGGTPGLPGLVGPGSSASGSVGSGNGNGNGAGGPSNLAGLGSPGGPTGPGGPGGTGLAGTNGLGGSGKGLASGPGTTAPGVGSGSGFAAGQGGTAPPNTDGAMPGQPASTLGPSVPGSNFAVGQSGSSAFPTNSTGTPGGQTQVVQSPIQPPPALMPLPGQVGSAAPGTSGTGAPGQGRTPGSGTTAPGEASTNGQPTSAGPNGGGAPLAQGEKRAPASAGNSLPGGQGTGDGPVVPAPTVPTPSGLQVKRSTQQTPRPVRLAGEREWVLYVECRADGVILHPSLRSFPAATLATVQGRTDLMRAASSLLERRQNTANQLGDKTFKPQVRFLVWPDGQRIYHSVYPALDGLPAPKTMQTLTPDDDVDRITSS